MALTVDEIKTYLRIDSTDEDTLLERLQATAVATLKGAVDDFDTGLKDNSFAQRAEMIELAIIADLYENRNAGGIEVHKYSRPIESMIRQLQTWPIDTDAADKDSEESGDTEQQKSEPQQGEEPQEQGGDGS